MDYSNIIEIKEVFDSSKVNELLKIGRIIFTQFNKDGRPMFVMAKREKLKAVARTGFRRDNELEAVTLNDYLEAGWDLIRDYVVDNREFTDCADQTVVFVMGWYGDETPCYPVPREQSSLT